MMANEERPRTRSRRRRARTPRRCSLTLDTHTDGRGGGVGGGTGTVGAEAGRYTTRSTRSTVGLHTGGGSGTAVPSITQRRLWHGQPGAENAGAGLPRL